MPAAFRRLRTTLRFRSRSRSGSDPLRERQQGRTEGLWDRGLGLAPRADRHLRRTRGDDLADGYREGYRDGHRTFRTDPKGTDRDVP